jgi:hypothetical protein
MTNLGPRRSVVTTQPRKGDFLYFSKRQDQLWALLNFLFSGYWDFFSESVAVGARVWPTISI